jgi:hypothetical protein
MKKLIRIGDCFSIPLADGTYAFAQYIYDHPTHGSLIRVFNKIEKTLVTAEDLRHCTQMFPPVFVGLHPPIRAKRWHILGNLPIVGFVFPKFRFSFSHQKGINHDWQIWDGTKYQHVGSLPPECKTLENIGIYAYGDLEERILTGRNVFCDGVE